MAEEKKIPTYELDGKPLHLIIDTNEVCVISKVMQGGEWLEVRRLMCMSCTSDFPYTMLKPIDRELTSQEWERFASYPGARAYIPAPLPIPNLYQKPLSKKILHLFQSLVGFAVLILFLVFLWNVIDFKMLGAVIAVLCGMAFGGWGLYGLIKRGFSFNQEDKE
jgi:hypothetical protein